MAGLIPVCPLNYAIIEPAEIIHSQNSCDIATLETYYFNFFASQLYTQKWLYGVLRMHNCEPASYIWNGMENGGLVDVDGAGGVVRWEGG